MAIDQTPLLGNFDFIRVLNIKTSGQSQKMDRSKVLSKHYILYPNPYNIRA